MTFAEPWNDPDLKFNPEKEVAAVHHLILPKQDSQLAPQTIAEPAPTIEIVSEPFAVVRKTVELPVAEIAW